MHTWISPAAWAAKRGRSVLKARHRLQVAPPSKRSGIDIGASTKHIERAPVARRARGVVTLGTLAPVAIFDRKIVFRRLHGCRVARHIPLSTAAQSRDMIVVQIKILSSG